MSNDDEVWLGYLNGAPVVKSEDVLLSLNDTLEARKADEERERRLHLQANRTKAVPRKQQVGPK